MVGNAGLDTEVFLDSDEVDLARDSSFTRNVDVVGQAGAYCARGFAALGRPAVFLGSLGDDPAGEQVTQSLHSAGVEVNTFIDPAGTARSVNLMTRDGSRRAFYDGRGHMDVEAPGDLVRRSLVGVRLAHFSLANWSRNLLAPARRTGAVISVDLQDVDGADDPYRGDFVAAADALFMSAAHLRDPAATARQLMERGAARVVVIGMGAEGVLTVRRRDASETRGGTIPTEYNVSHCEPPDLDVPIVDTNGAGDGLAVGFLDAYALDGLSVGEAARRGQIVARWTCGQVGGDDPLDRERLRQIESGLTASSGP